jgi:hypothetical protein
MALRVTLPSDVPKKQLALHDLPPVRAKLDYGKPPPSSDDAD